MITPAVARIITTGGQDAELPASGVICLVGSNNVGKSQMLRDIRSLLGDGQPEPIVLDRIELSREPLLPHEQMDTVLPTFEQWLRKNFTPVPQPNGQTLYQAVPGGPAVPPHQGFISMNQNHHSLGQMRDFYCLFAEAGTRVALADPLPNRSGTSPNPHPLARVFWDGPLETRLRELCSDVFGFGITLDRLSESTQFRAGEVDVPIPPFNEPSPEYAQAVAELPPLHNQGDGVRSFVGLALHVLAGAQNIILIDEPEAFLHPAQARSFGRWLAGESRDSGRQVIIATHSRDLLIGLLEGEATATVIRLDRIGDKCNVTQLPTTDLSEVWADPVLRYSNVLDGLFYRTVVVCEADADCRFYSAVLDALAPVDALETRSSEILFVPSGGKDGIPKIARTLTQLGVLTSAIADFDVFRSRTKVIEILESVGGHWDDGLNEQYVSMAEALNADGGTKWNSAKTHGSAAVPPGVANTSAAALVAELARRRLIVVPSGELESFDRSTALKGSAWVSNALHSEVHRTSAAAQALMTLI